MKRYRPWEPGQAFLLPPSPHDWLPEGHLAFFILDVVRDLDLSAIEMTIRQKDPRGNRPFDPRMMVALLLYGNCMGVQSSRKLERAAQEDIALLVLCAGSRPDHSAISAFRKQHLKALGGLFLQVLRLCQEAGLVKLGHVSLDGTKMQANASKHKAMSYDRMLKTEEELAEKVRALLEEGVSVDHAEDELHGKDRRGDELPEELRRAGSRLKKIREAKKALEAEAARARAKEKKQQAENAKEAAKQADEKARGPAEGKLKAALKGAAESATKAMELSEERVADAREETERADQEADSPRQRRLATKARQRLQAAERELEKTKEVIEGAEDTTDEPELPEHQVPFDREGNPADKAQRNFTDPDSRLMKKGGEFIQGFNCQTVVDDAHQVILAQAVTNQAPDQQHLKPLLHQAAQNCGAVAEVFSADAGYVSEANIEYCDNMGLDAYIATGRQKHGGGSSEQEESKQKGGDRTRAMREKLATEDGKAVYARRKAIAEPPYGQIKEARGIRRFLLRGLDAVQHEWAWICAGHNLLKLFRAPQPS